MQIIYINNFSCHFMHMYILDKITAKLTLNLFRFEKIYSLNIDKTHKFYV